MCIRDSIGSVRQFYEFIAVDACGNTTTEAAEFFINDTSAPSLTCPKDTAIYCTDNPSFSFTGVATAADACAGVVVPTFTDNTGAPGCVQTITRTWSAVDPCGNTTSCDQIITISDTIPPVALNFAESLTVECDGFGNLNQLSNWLADRAGAVAQDDCGTLEIVFYELASGSRGQFLCEECFDYEFYAKDGCTIDSTFLGEASFCIEDTTAPTFSMLAVDTTVECDGSGNLPDLTSWLNNNGGAVATETCSEIIWSNELINTMEGCGLTASYTYEFTAEDSCGHEIITTADFNIIDNSAPVWLNLPKDTIVICDGNGNGFDLTSWVGRQIALTNVSDGCGVQRIDFQNLSEVNPDFCEGQVQSIYEFTVIDSCGNSTSQRATFQIIDNVAPTITCPADVTLSLIHI